MKMKIYLTNLAKYNEGKLVGKWLKLPLTENELQAEIQEVLGTDEEYFITDYEADFTIDEYENVTELNEFAEQIQDLEEHEEKCLIYLIDVIGLDREEAFEHYEDVTFYSDMKLIDVAYELVDNGRFGDIADDIQRYIDYEAIARDLDCGGYHETEKGVFFYQ